jgi:isocitrate dehydrogenase (NAD+)
MARMRRTPARSVVREADQAADGRLDHRAGTTFLGRLVRATDRTAADRPLDRPDHLAVRPLVRPADHPRRADIAGYNRRMAHRVTLIPGDGIGPELAEATRRVLEATGIAFDWEVQEAGEAMIAEHGTPLPEAVLESIRRNKVALKGPITTPVGGGFRSANVTLRQALGLYANVRPARSMKGLETRYEDVDLVIVRENTEDLYAGIEHMVGPDAAESIKIITRAASERIARYAFEYAVANGRRKVTAVHKANIMKLSDGLFLESCRTIAADYDGKIEFEDRIVDNMCMQLVQKPDLYDVMVLPNLYGDIVSDLCAGLVGGLGVAPGANIGTEAAVFEPVHGSAPKYAGLNKANPTALILSGVLMLRHLGEQAAAVQVETALREVIADGRRTTYDLGGEAGTSQFADAIIERLAASSPAPDARAAGA